MASIYNLKPAIDIVGLRLARKQPPGLYVIAPSTSAAHRHVVGNNNSVDQSTRFLLLRVANLYGKSLMNAKAITRRLNVALCVTGQSLVEEKVRQLQSENGRLHTAVDQQRQLNVASQQRIHDLQLVSQHQQLYASLL